jgi:hypothetical protein
VGGVSDGQGGLLKGLRMGRVIVSAHELEPGRFKLDLVD